MKREYRAEIAYIDRNMPTLYQYCDTLDMAMAQVNHWYKVMAGIRRAYITGNGKKHVYYSNGEYLFTINLVKKYGGKL